MAGLVDIGADAANNAEIEADMAASVLCDIWHLDDAKGALHLPHRGATLPWAELQRSGVQHFKMVLPDDASSYSWAADPELKEVLERLGAVSSHRGPQPQGLGHAS